MDDEIAEDVLHQLVRLTAAVDNLTAITLAVGLRATDVSNERMKQDLIDALVILKREVDE